MIIDAGMYFDGRCCRCRGWISCTGDQVWMAATPMEGVRHTTAHARCCRLVVAMGLVRELP